MKRNITHSERRGSGWVVVQFLGLALALVPLASGFSVEWSAVTCAVAGTLLAGWTLRHNPPGNFRIRPAPARRGRLVSTGPYRWIRHPMYASLLLFLMAAALTAESWIAWVGVVTAAVAVERKARLEEVLLAGRFAAYAAYQKRTRRLLPGIW